jgi:hypothetical protein
MKHFTLSTLGLILSLPLFAQTVQDSVEMGAGYTNSVFYKLSSGAETVVSNANWDIALETSSYGICIRINGQADTELWEYPNGDTTAWASIDTAGLETWVPLYDSDTEWFYGAFETAAGNDPFDLGWGQYNPMTHHIIGTRLFVIKLSNGEYQKIWIKSLIGGVYNIRHGSLDGTMDLTHMITKADFSTKNFAYFSLQNHSTIDREPSTSDWDFVVQKYVGSLGVGQYYGVTGILTNSGVYAAEARGVDVNTAVYNDYSSDSLINTIGYDWKELDFTTFEYSIEDSLSYFISDIEGNIWQLVLTGFAGSSSGKVWFNKTLVSSTGIEDLETEINVAVYPNPSTDGNVSLVFNLEENEAIANVYDMAGKLVATQTFQEKGFKERNLRLNNPISGSYILRLTTEKMLITKKIVIR